MPSFPTVRPRRLRRTARLREIVRETRLHPSMFVLPLFVVPGRDVATAIPSMPGVRQWSVDRVGEAVAPAVDAGVRAVILFGIPEAKDAVGSHAWREDAPVQRALGELRRAFPELVLITDVCLCEYTDHGHCGVVRDGDVANDPTLDLLAARPSRTRGRAPTSSPPRT
jgi:porphobilinogen synthase